MNENFTFPPEIEAILSDESPDGVFFYAEDVEVPNFKNIDDIKDWIRHIATKENKELGYLQYIFCSDEYLLKINKEHLDHDYYTDIITFPYNSAPIEGDVFISIDRVKDNAQQFEVNYEIELYRVLAHGLLHLCGYLDKTEAEISVMREKENEYMGEISKFI
ncbi:MAG: rRNA maturation RNase YbeY [Saprospiraceae bacterium]|nr:rRNA maturation RNase YbeY [Saprospiraceae bacterium]